MFGWLIGTTVHLLMVMADVFVLFMLVHALATMWPVRGRFLATMDTLVKPVVEPMWLALDSAVMSIWGKRLRPGAKLLIWTVLFFIARSALHDVAAAWMK